MVATTKPQNTFEEAGRAADRSAASGALSDAQQPTAMDDMSAEALRKRRLDAAIAALERNREALALLSKA